MTHGHGRTWLRRCLFGLVLVLAGAGAWVGMHRTELQVRYAAHRLTTATEDGERRAWADRLLSHGDPGTARLLQFVKAGDAGPRSAALGSLGEHLAVQPDGDPRAAALCSDLLDAIASADEPGRAAAVELLPIILKRIGSAHTGKCREFVAAALRMPVPAKRLAAIQAALHPALRMRADLIPLMDDPEAAVRRTALFAVGTATDEEQLLADEELFRWLNDPDASVRAICRDALGSRGRSDSEIARGRQLAHPEPTERLNLLLDLRHDAQLADPEPWLERLSRDESASVRAAAVRVMVELASERRLPTPGWVHTLAGTDRDLQVRRIAKYYTEQNNGQTTDPAIRSVGAP